MLDTLFAIGQAASVLLILFGAVLTIGTVIFPQRQPRTLEQEHKDELLLLKYIL